MLKIDTQHRLKHVSASRSEWDEINAPSRPSGSPPAGPYVRPYPSARMWAKAYGLGPGFTARRMEESLRNPSGILEDSRGIPEGIFEDTLRIPLRFLVVSLRIASGILEESLRIP